MIVETDSVTGKTIAYDWPRGALKWPHVSFAIPIGMERGRPEPLGASRASPNSIGPGYVNFALHSAIAEKSHCSFNGLMAMGTNRRLLKSL